MHRLRVTLRTVREWNSYAKAKDYSQLVWSESAAGRQTDIHRCLLPSRTLCVFLHDFVLSLAYQMAVYANSLLATLNARSYSSGQTHAPPTEDYTRAPRGDLKRTPGPIPLAVRGPRTAAEHGPLRSTWPDFGGISVHIEMAQDTSLEGSMVRIMHRCRLS